MKLAYALALAYYFLGAIPCAIFAWRLTKKIKIARRQELVRIVLLSILFAPVIFRNDGIQIIPAILYFIVPSFRKIENSLLIGAYHITIFVLPAWIMVRIIDATIASYPLIKDDLRFAKQSYDNIELPGSKEFTHWFWVLFLVVILALLLSMYFYLNEKGIGHFWTSS